MHIHSPSRHTSSGRIRPAENTYYACSVLHANAFMTTPGSTVNSLVTFSSIYATTHFVYGGTLFWSGVCVCVCVCVCECVLYCSVLYCSVVFSLGGSVSELKRPNPSWYSQKRACTETQSRKVCTFHFAAVLLRSGESKTAQRAITVAEFQHLEQKFPHNVLRKMIAKCW